MTNSPSVLIVFFLMVAAYRAEKKAVAVIERGLGFCNVCELRRQAQAIFCRRLRLAASSAHQQPQYQRQR